jgi:hypothetical protein
MDSPARGATGHPPPSTTKRWSAIKPPPMMQALAVAVYGNKVHFGLTLEQPMAPNLR